MVRDMRESERFDAEIVVAVKSSWGDSKLEYHVSKNISKKGVYLVGEDPPEIDADLQMEFSLPQNGIHLTLFGEMFYGWVEGTVIWVDSKGYAVKFEDGYSLSFPV